MHEDYDDHYMYIPYSVVTVFGLEIIFRIEEVLLKV